MISSVIIDTSVFISGIITPRGTAGRALDQAFDFHNVLFSDATFSELERKLKSRKLATYLDPAIAARVVNRCLAYGRWLNPPCVEPTSRDPEDDMFLALALSGNAKTIVSLDKDLLVLHPWRGVKISKPAAFLAEHRLNQ